MDITEDGVAVDDVVGLVKRVIRAANISTTDLDRDLRVVGLHLTLNTVAASTAGGRVELRIPFVGMKLRLGGSVSRRDTHTVEITLVPPDLAGQYEVRDGRIETALLGAITGIREVIARGAGGHDPFQLETSTVTLTFAITRDGTLSLGAEGELHDDVTHTLRLDLEPVR